MRQKVVTLDALQRIVSEAQARGGRVVLCHGCFDPLHIGHIRYFHEAKRHGDVLVVTVTPDKYVNKGEGRPFQSEAIRAEAVAALEAVDYVAINKWPTAVETLRFLRPDVYAKGAEFREDHMDPTGRIAVERREAQKLGIEMIFTDTMMENATALLSRLARVLEGRSKRGE